MNPSPHTGPRPSAARRIGLFGGTFDPIHLGHIEVAEAARRRFRLNEICLVPAAQPPHKRPGPVTTPADRLAMVRLAAADRPHFSVSAMELERQGPSFTIETIAQTQIACAPNTELFFLIGYDAFLEFNTWKSYNTILRKVDLIVLARGHLCGHRLEPNYRGLEAVYPPAP